MQLALASMHEHNIHMWRVTVLRSFPPQLQANFKGGIQQAAEYRSHLQILYLVLQVAILAVQLLRALAVVVGAAAITRLPATKVSTCSDNSSQCGRTNSSMPWGRVWLVVLLVHTACPATTLLLVR
jgi:hypothetical protein